MGNGKSEGLVSCVTPESARAVYGVVCMLEHNMLQLTVRECSVALLDASPSLADSYIVHCLQAARFMLAVKARHLTCKARKIMAEHCSVMRPLSS